MGRSDFKKGVFDILEIAVSGDLKSKAFDAFIITLIILNVVVVMLETVEALAVQYATFFALFEVFSIAVFTVEYLLRLWSCVSKKAFRHPITGRLRFAFTPLVLIDLLAILPFYIPIILPLDLRFLRALRLLRIFRSLKMTRYSNAMELVISVLKQKKEELFSTAFIMLVLLMFTSSFMFFVEHDAQPQAFSNVFDAMWWGAMTLTTVGYGDIYPVTLFGKVLCSVFAILGFALFALPAGILASGFIREIGAREGKVVCPHCGKPIRKPRNM